MRGTRRTVSNQSVTWKRRPGGVTLGPPHQAPQPRGDVASVGIVRMRSEGRRRNGRGAQASLGEGWHPTLRPSLPRKRPGEGAGRRGRRFGPRRGISSACARWARVVHLLERCSTFVDAPRASEVPHARFEPPGGGSGAYGVYEMRDGGHTRQDLSLSLSRARAGAPPIPPYGILHARTSVRLLDDRHRMCYARVMRYAGTRSRRTRGHHQGRCPMCPELENQTVALTCGFCSVLR